ncbi:hypothetical protein GC173_11935 [bacterium]|nr:hypothetical protein [bacterium]
MQRRPNTVNRIDLERDLREAGVRDGDLLVVHSSLSRVGWIQGGPLDALAALRAVLGPRGTLVMPTFTFNLSCWGMPPFDPERTPSRVGVLTDALRHLDGSVRSSHPTHSVAAIGPLAADLIGDRIDYEPLGIGSPLDRAQMMGGRILLIGVGQNRNSTVHVAECYAQVPYFAVNFSEDSSWDEAWYLNEKGGRELVIIDQMPGSSEGFDVLENPLRRMGVVRDVMIGEAPSQMMEGNRLCVAVTSLLMENPALLLGGDATSDITRRRRLHTMKVLNQRSHRPTDLTPILQGSAP